MSSTFSLITLIEVAVGIFLIWGFWNEQKLVELEDKLFAKLGIRRKRNTAKIIKFKSGTPSGCDRNCI